MFENQKAPSPFGKIPIFLAAKTQLYKFTCLSVCVSICNQFEILTTYNNQHYMTQMSLNYCQGPL